MAKKKETLKAESEQPIILSDIENQQNFDSLIDTNYFYYHTLIDFQNKDYNYRKWRLGLNESLGRLKIFLSTSKENYTNLKKFFQLNKEFAVDCFQLQQDFEISNYDAIINFIENELNNMKNIEAPALNIEEQDANNEIGFEAEPKEILTPKSLNEAANFYKKHIEYLHEAYKKVINFELIEDEYFMTDSPEKSFLSAFTNPKTKTSKEFVEYLKEWLSVNTDFQNQITNYKIISDTLTKLCNSLSELPINLKHNPYKGFGSGYYWELNKDGQSFIDRISNGYKDFSSNDFLDTIRIDVLETISLVDELFPKQIKEVIEKDGTQKKVEHEAPKTFEELFYDTSLISPCINILKEINPPLIDAECNYIGKSKGAFCVWIDEMRKQAIVKHFSDRKIYALLLPQKIKRFSINESMFGKVQQKAENQYRTDIKTLLSGVKLSQISQKGKLGK